MPLVWILSIAIGLDPRGREAVVRLVVHELVITIAELEAPPRNHLPSRAAEPRGTDPYELIARRPVQQT